MEVALGEIRQPLSEIPAETGSGVTLEIRATRAAAEADRISSPPDPLAFGLVKGSVFRSLAALDGRYFSTEPAATSRRLTRIIATLVRIARCLCRAGFPLLIASGCDADGTEGRGPQRCSGTPGGAGHPGPPRALRITGRSGLCLATTRKPCRAKAAATPGNMLRVWPGTAVSTG